MPFRSSGLPRLRSDHHALPDLSTRGIGHRRRRQGHHSWNKLLDWLDTLYRGRVRDERIVDGNHRQTGADIVGERHREAECCAGSCRKSTGQRIDDTGAMSAPADRKIRVHVAGTGGRRVRLNGVIAPSAASGGAFPGYRRSGWHQRPQHQISIDESISKLWRQRGQARQDGRGHHVSRNPRERIVDFQARGVFGSLLRGECFTAVRGLTDCVSETPLEKRRDRRSERLRPGPPPSRCVTPRPVVRRAAESPRDWRTFPPALMLPRFDAGWGTRVQRVNSTMAVASLPAPVVGLPCRCCGDATASSGVSSKAMGRKRLRDMSASTLPEASHAVPSGG